MVPSGPVGTEVSQVRSRGADAQGPDGGGRSPAEVTARRRLGRVLGVAVVVVAAALAVVFARTSGIPDDRLVDHASRVQGLAAVLPVTGDPPRVAGMRFPSLAASGWVATGGRRDAVGDRTATTAFYEGGGGRRLAVTILSGQALPPPPGSTVIRRDGIALARTTDGDRVILSWRRAGRTTIMSAVQADPADLAALARAATPDPRRRR